MGKPFSDAGNYSEIFEIRDRILSSYLKLDTLSTDPMLFFVEGRNNIQASTSAINTTIKAFDDAVMVGNYIVGISGLALASPTVSLFSVSRYISTVLPHVYSFDISPITLTSNIAIEANCRISRAEMQERGLYILIQNGSRKFLFRVNTVTLTVTSMAFTGVSYPQVSTLEYLELDGKISIAYRVASNGTIVAMRSDNHANGLSQFEDSSLTYMDSSLHPKAALSLSYVNDSLTVSSVKTGLAINPAEYIYSMRNLSNPQGSPPP